MAKLFRRLAVGYSAGIDIRAVYLRETEMGSSVYRLKSRTVVQQLGQGKSLAESMQAADGFFPELVLAVVGAGEQGGRLDESFNRLAVHYENLVKFRNGLLISIAWPMFELTFAIIIIGALILVLGTLFGDAAADWFGMGSTIANFSFYVFCVASVVTAIGMLFHGTKNGWFGTLPMRLAAKIPIVGKTIEALALSRMAWAMSISENAGMDAVETAKMSLRATQNYFYQRLEETVCRSIQLGNDFTTALQQTSSFPTEFLIYVENGELAGSLAETMDRASMDLQSRAESNLKLLGTIGFVCTLLLVAVIIGTVVIAMWKKVYLDPLHDLMNM